MTKTAKKTKLIMKADRIAVRPDPVVETTEGGIHLSEGAQEAPLRGIVVDAGPDAGFSKGDRVIYTSYAGSIYDVDGESLLFMRGEDVLAQVEE